MTRFGPNIEPITLPTTLSRYATCYATDSGFINLTKIHIATAAKWKDRQTKLSIEYMHIEQINIKISAVYLNQQLSKLCFTHWVLHTVNMHYIIQSRTMHVLMKLSISQTARPNRLCFSGNIPNMVKCQDLMFFFVLSRIMFGEYAKSVFLLF